MSERVMNIGLLNSMAASESYTAEREESQHDGQLRLALSSSRCRDRSYTNPTNCIESQI